MQKPFLQRKKLYLCFKHVNYFSADKPSDKENPNMLSLEVDGRGLLNILFLLFVVSLIFFSSLLYEARVVDEVTKPLRLVFRPAH